MQFVLFSSPTNFDEEIALIHHFLADEKLVLHLRKPGFSMEEMSSFIGKISVKHHSQLVVHQYIDLLTKFNLKGFHCTRSFLKNNATHLGSLKTKFPGSTFSRSCHSLEELNELPAYSYVFLSPVFDSISKQGYSSSFNIAAINNALLSVQVPVYALGGISNKEIELLKKSNFKGIGVLGYIWNSSTPKENYATIKKALFFN